MIVKNYLSGRKVEFWPRKRMAWLGTVALIVAGCGATPTPVASTTSASLPYPGTGYYPIPGSAFGPTLGITGACAVGAPMDFTSACTSCFGGALSTYAGAQVCRFNQTLSVMPSLYNGGSPIPVLDPTDPSGPLSNPVYRISSWNYSPVPATNAVYLKRGYRMSFNGSGTYDYNSNGSAICGNGNDYTYAGIKQDTSQQWTNVSNGQTMGLYGSDGTEAFYLGNSLSSKLINNDGVLRVGINIDPTQLGYGPCFRFSNWKVTLQGCVDTAYNAVSGCI